MYVCMYVCMYVWHILRKPEGVQQWGECLHLHVLGWWNSVEVRMLPVC